MSNRSHLPDTLALARGFWPSILIHIGIDPRFLVNRHGPCPICTGSDRFRFDNLNGDGTFFCSHCHPGKGINLVMNFLQISFPEACTVVDKVLGIQQNGGIYLSGKVQTAKVERDTTGRSLALKKARYIWQSSKPIQRNDRVFRYLESRGIFDADRFANIRLHPNCFFCTGQSMLAMIAKIESSAGEFVGVHKTFLHGERKAGDDCRRLAKGIELSGGAVRLQSWNGATTIGVAEGIESAISAQRTFLVPTFAALSTSNLKNFAPPVGVERVLIFGDNDFAGHQASTKLRETLEEQGYEVIEHFPDPGLGDWNDYLIANTESVSSSHS